MGRSASRLCLWLATWNYLTTPFLFRRPGFQVSELGPWQEAGQTWRRLRVVFPPNVATHCPEQTFYFDANFLQRRMDFQAIVAGGSFIAQYTHAHQSFSGIVLPTLRRAMRIGSDGGVVAGSAELDIEIFDTMFE